MWDPSDFLSSMILEVMHVLSQRLIYIFANFYDNQKHYFPRFQSLYNIFNVYSVVEQLRMFELAHSPEGKNGNVEFQNCNQCIMGEYSTVVYLHILLYPFWGLLFLHAPSRTTSSILWSTLLVNVNSFMNDQSSTSCCI